MKIIKILSVFAAITFASCGTTSEIESKGPAASRIETPGKTTGTKTKITARPLPKPTNNATLQQQAESR